MLFNRLIFVILIFVLSVLSEDKENVPQEEKLNEEEPKVDDSVTKAKEPSKTDDEVVKREEEAITIDGLNVAQIKELREKAEKYKFQTEVNRMMKLIINSLYKNKDIFLRELISNASDALDKIRFISLTDPDSSIDHDDLIIKIKADKDRKTLHILDTGIGMTKNELINNLGTIAKSGTNEFFSKAAESKSSTELTDLIGQFGVGFYSSFLVADRVTVVSKSEADQQYIWESDSSSFSVSLDPRGSTLTRGTEIILHLKEEAHEYLDPEKLNNLIHKYSQFINFPIYLWQSSTKTVSESDEVAVSKQDDDATVSDENKPKEVEKTVWDWALVNKNKPIWTRKAGEVTEEEYNEFFKSFSKETNDPMTKIHFTAEGEVSFKSILFVPQVFNHDNKEKNDNIKLYVKRVFITDHFEDLMPKYLNFIKGIVDSDDLPLNVSRETLQQSKLLKVIKKKLIRKTLDMLKKLNTEQYDKFWKEYSTLIKSGVLEDSSNRNRLAKLLKFWSSNNTETMIRLDDYVSRMKPTQTKIYYIAGDDYKLLLKSPMVERLLARNYEVLFFVDAMDEYAIQSLSGFDNKQFQSIAKEGFQLEDDNDLKLNKEEALKQYNNVIEWLKKDGLGNYIEKVEISERLTDVPALVVASTYGASGSMERLMKSQAYQRNVEINEYSGNQKKVLEINPNHKLIKSLRYSLMNNRPIEETKNLAHTIYDFALMRSGFNLPKISHFQNRLETTIRKLLDIPLDEKVELEEETIEPQGIKNVETPKDTENVDVEKEEKNNDETS